MSLLIGTNGSRSSLISTAADRNFVIKIIRRYFLPNIGQLAHIARKNMPSYAIDFLGTGTQADPYSLKPNSDEFNGWVLADGKYYSKDSFPDAWNVFATDRGESYFRIPCIDDFIKANANAQTYVEEQHSSTIVDHCHKIDINGEKKTTGRIINALSCYVSGGTNKTGLMFNGDRSSPNKTVYKTISKQNVGKFLNGGEYDSFAPVFHTGGGTEDNPTVLKNIDLNIPPNASFKDVKLNYNGNDNEIRPRCVCIYTMVYIGRQIQ